MENHGWTRRGVGGRLKKVKGIGNVVLNTWKLHWISESKMMNTRNSYYNKRKKMDKLDENWEAANWTETAGGGKLGENHGCLTSWCTDV